MLDVVFRPLMGGIVDQQIQMTKFTDALINQSNALPLFANIAGSSDAATPLLFHQVRRILCVLMFAEIGNENSPSLVAPTPPIVPPFFFFSP